MTKGVGGGRGHSGDTRINSRDELDEGREEEREKRNEWQDGGQTRLALKGPRIEAPRYVNVTT